MKRKPATEIDQWATLRMVVQAGSFARAAEILNRSQSSVSYGIARLQEQLGFPLLEIEGRKAVLTEAGERLLSEVSPLIDELVRVEERGRLWVAGHEPRIRLYVDSLAPRALIFSALSTFQQEYGSVEIILNEQIRRPLEELDRNAFDLAIGYWENDGRHAVHLINVELVAVARSDHSLHAQQAPISKAVLSQFPVAVLGHDKPASVIPRAQHIYVNSLEAAVEAVRCGFCHARLPRHMIAEDLAEGRLKEVKVRHATRIIPLALAFADEDMAGPLTLRLADIMKQTFGNA